MLEGLEISVLNLSEVTNENHSFRFDSEYVKKEYLQNIEELLSKKHYKLNSHIKHMSGGATPLGAEYQDSGIPFLRVQNIMQNHFNLSDVVYISDKQDEEIKRSRLKLNDVLLTITGVSYGKSATVNKELVNSNINQHSVKISLKDNLNPYFLSTFLNCSYGKTQSDKNIVGVTRPALDYTVIKNFIIPNLDLTFQNEIEKLIVKSENKTTESKNLYTQAENLLLQEIGLQDFTPSQEAVNIKSYSESFNVSGRLDAEYYQPKYEQYENLVTGQKHTFIKDEYLHIVKKSKKDKTGYNYIEIGDINVGDGSNSSNYVLTEGLPANAKTLIKKGDILISNVRPYRGAVTIINSEEKDLIVSGAFTVLRKNPNSIYNNQVLQVLLRSSVYKDWLLKFNVGTSYPVIKDDDVLNLPIPFIGEQKQEKIAELIEESFSLKKQSEHLLEVAKKAVEIAIEENEEVALKFIHSNQN